MDIQHPSFQTRFTPLVVSSRRSRILARKSFLLGRVRFTSAFDCRTVAHIAKQWRVGRRGEARGAGRRGNTDVLQRLYRSPMRASTMTRSVGYFIPGDRDFRQIDYVKAFAINHRRTATRPADGPPYQPTDLYNRWRSRPCSVGLI